MELGKGMGKKFPWLNFILFILTLITTSLGGALQLGINPLKEGWLFSMHKGLPFAIALMTVLGIHELGHYFTAKKFGVEVTLPYFIPAPTFLGTFGAFIKMKSPVSTRKELALVAFMGPLAGFIASIIVTWIGLRFSQLKIATSSTQGITLGDPLIMKLLYSLYFGSIGEKEIFLHPIAFAGWIGFFVTSLNLLPASQLDGGHIFFSVFDRFHSYMTKITIVILFVLGLMGWKGWIVWGFLILIIGTKHPPLILGYFPPDKITKIIFLLATLIFLLTFIPVPFKI